MTAFWIVAAFVAGGVIGALAVGYLASGGRSDAVSDAYDAGYHDGRNDRPRRKVL